DKPEEGKQLPVTASSMYNILLLGLLLLAIGGATLIVLKRQNRINSK
ncbi:MAG: hypothetical protein K0Q87_3122, partial [Neobacillus sp.]|nr:hypothetical protein [Neobacillus sp.]